MSELESIEKNKDKMDLKPNIKFVTKHLQFYKDGIKKLLSRPTTAISAQFVKKIKITDMYLFTEPQIDFDYIASLLLRMPICLIKLSELETISYQMANVVPVPCFNEAGLFNKQVDFVSVDDFPRQNDHPSRILIGYTTYDGKTICPSPIPKSLFSSYTSCFYYQIHVFLHEFFHTIEISKRSSKQRSNIVLNFNDEEFTFQDWWNDCEKLILSDREPRCISSYASNYIEVLNKETKNNNPEEFTYALAEQIAEIFVAYMLGIVSNDMGWTNFKEESFGNEEHHKYYQQQKLLGKEEFCAANEKWILMDKLCRAKLIKS